MCPMVGISVSEAPAWLVMNAVAGPCGRPTSESDHKPTLGWLGRFPGCVSGESGPEAVEGLNGVTGRA